MLRDVKGGIGQGRVGDRDLLSLHACSFLWLVVVQAVVAHIYILFYLNLLFFVYKLFFIL